MDALAHYRIANGEKAVSIDLSIIDDEGLVSENQGLMIKLKASGASFDKTK